jgi:hypothetical protein
MSFDVTVLPASPEPPTWASLRDAIVAEWRESANERAPALALTRAPEHHLLAGDERLTPERGYRFAFDAPSELWLFVMVNAAMGLDEDRWLEANARNLDEPSTRALADRWRRSGLHYVLSSGPGRDPGEIDHLVIVATALARLSNGAVVVTDNAFLSSAVGVFSPDQFRTTRERIPDWKL